MRLCVRWLHVCAGEEKRTLRKSAFWAGDVTEKRILCRRRHLDVTEKRILHQRRHRDVTKGRTLHASGGCVESPFPPICVHFCAPHACSHNRAGPRIPRHRGPHGPRDARALGPDTHATEAVTQPPAHTSSRSPPLACKKHPVTPYAPGLPSLLSRRALTWRRSCLSSLDASCIWSLTASWPVPP